MASNDKLAQRLQQPFETPVYYFASTEAEPLREAAKQVRGALLTEESGADYTRLDGPSPDLGSVIEAAGTISLFGTPRVVELREVSTSSVSDKDAAELAALFSELENAVLIVTVLHRDKKAMGTKKAKQLYEAAGKVGYVAELAKPSHRDNIAYINKAAEALGARFAPGAAEALLERAGEERPLLVSETQKLSAMSGYGEITQRMVERYSTHNIEADVFQLARQITGRRKADAYAKLDELFSLRHEPIAIAAALAGTFVDMYRVRCGSDKHLPVAAIFKELGYKGNDYRLQKAKENAARYTTAQLEDCVLCLYELDGALKSSALPDKSILVETAVGQLMSIGDKR